MVAFLLDDDLGHAGRRRQRPGLVHGGRDGTSGRRDERRHRGAAGPGGVVPLVPPAMRPSLVARGPKVVWVITHRPMIESARFFISSASGQRPGSRISP